METYPFPSSLSPLHSILIVDDDPDSAFLLKRDLLRAFPNAQIRETTSSAALQLLGLAALDLLVIAYRLQGLTGLELIAQVREKARRFPIAMMSSMPVDRAQALQAGADLFLTYDEAKEIGCQVRTWLGDHLADETPERRRRID